MKTSFHYFSFLALTSILMTSCFSKTKYIGHHTMISSLDDGKKVVYLDYTELNELDIKNVTDASVDYYSAALADFDLMTCSMEYLEKIDVDCIRRCKEVFDADLVIVSSRVNCREGLTRQKKPPPNDAMPYIENKTQDIGIIHFSIYDTEVAEELISFNVQTKSSGIGIKNDDDSTTNVNLSTCSYVLSKARRKGLKKIFKQLK